LKGSLEALPELWLPFLLEGRSALPQDGSASAGSEARSLLLENGRTAGTGVFVGKTCGESLSSRLLSNVDHFHFQCSGHQSDAREEAQSRDRVFVRRIADNMT
jgi:hypothetical protein